jgi:hypothetical protein
MNDSAAPILEGNTIEKNGSGGLLEGGVVITHSCRPDLGGGAGRSRGRNSIRANDEWDVYNGTTNDIEARGNTWDHRARADIDNTDIFDDTQDGTKGAVNF